MSKEEIAIITDSCTDVPKEYIDKYNIFVIPVTFAYKDKSYIDGIDITPDEVYNKLEIEVPKTSLPPIDLIKETFEKVIKLGYKKAIVITMSSGLSGTNNIINLIAKDYTDIEIYVLDSKNICLGAGITVITAAKLLEENYTFEQIKEKLNHVIKNTKIFFCVDTLEYLKKGGRIGLITCAVGTMLDLKPILTCNEDGICTTAAKCVGRKNSIKKTFDMAKNYASQFEKYNVVIANIKAPDEAIKMSERAKNELPNINLMIESLASPAVSIHSGPGLVGIGIQKCIF